MSERTAKQIIESLKNEYKGDSEALEEIARRENDIKYIEEQESKGGYTGQPSVGVALMLESDLKTWY